ncbi:hypothetical protein PDIG_50620 [Penicillium digitatum PHI26]|uniref:Uncharacterized protein n=2 Tax=Penicillium digitatum TaxID=36651 RepID=K9FP88_PEND2|nr:hypothetical protein PDIP_19860 [Penicillium digitatum Pd1]EKV11425.1 hypothetical protein PDIG_50620 [Penicillium digitatum PHI26]EKV20100.1 hypothetical protein PDIP_19860 [Penicillium digitatum Pd1]
MGSTNLDIEQKVLAGSPATREERFNSYISPCPEKEP